MRTRTLYSLFLFGLLALTLVSVMSAFAAANTVPLTRLTDQSRAITANDLKPPECAALTLQDILVCPSGGGFCSGGNRNSLILGSANADTISGGPGTDCILGGGGDDSIDGGPHTDVCIGGPGNDTFSRCETVYQ